LERSQEAQETPRPLDRAASWPVLLPIALLGLAFAAPLAAHAAYPPATNGKIAFVRDGDIWIMQGDGAGQVSLTGNPSLELAPQFSPNGKRIIFGRLETNSFLWTMRTNGTQQLNLTAGDVSSASYPAYRPDGKRIAFNYGDLGIYSLDPSGANPVPLAPGTAEPENATATFADWSPDGKRVVFQRCVNGPPSDSRICRIAIVNSDGSGFKYLTTGIPPGLFGGSVDDYRPEFSPDGTRIVFAREFSGGDWDIFLINADGSGLLGLTLTDPLFEFGPSFSPDGKSIAFTRDLGGSGADNYDIFVMNADGSNPTDLTAGSPANESEPTWQYRHFCGSRKASRRAATIVGTEGKDKLKGTGKADVIVALSGDDVIKSLGGDDYLCGGSGDDTLKAGAGDDVVLAAGGNDKIDPGPGRNRVKPGKGKDKVEGG